MEDDKKEGYKIGMENVYKWIVKYCFFFSSQQFFFSVFPQLLDQMDLESQMSLMLCFLFLGIGQRKLDQRKYLC